MRHLSQGISVADHNHVHLDYLGFQLVKPSAPLRDIVKDFWLIRGQNITQKQEQFLHPGGGMGLVFNLGDCFLIDGEKIESPTFLDGANSFSRRWTLTGEIHAIGFTFKPGGGFPFFKMPLHELIDNPYDLGDIELHRASEVIEQVVEAKSLTEKVQRLENWLIAQLDEERTVTPTINNAMTMIDQSQGQQQIENVASEIGISRRQLERQYKEQVGLSPKHHARLLRVNQARLMLKDVPIVSLADVAYHAGFYDQSHFIREFKSIVGMTPGAYHQRQLDRLHQYRDK